MMNQVHDLTKIITEIETITEINQGSEYKERVSAAADLHQALGQLRAARTWIIKAGRKIGTIGDPK